jgi:hypothetical protein
MGQPCEFQVAAAGLGAPLLGSSPGPGGAAAGVASRGPTSRLHAAASLGDAAELRRQVCHYMTQPLVELYGGCMVVLKVS